MISLLIDLLYVRLGIEDTCSRIAGSDLGGAADAILGAIPLDLWYSLPDLPDAEDRAVYTYLRELFRDFQ